MGKYSKSEKWSKQLHPSLPPLRLSSPQRPRSPQRRPIIQQPPSWLLLPSLPWRTRRDHPVRPSRSTSPPPTRLTLSNLAPTSRRLWRAELTRRPSLPSRDPSSSPRSRNPRRRSSRRPLRKSPKRLRNPLPKRPRRPRRLSKRLRLPRRLPNPQLPPQRRLQQRVRRRPKKQPPRRQPPRRNKHYSRLI